MRTNLRRMLAWGTLLQLIAGTALAEDGSTPFLGYLNLFQPSTMTPTAAQVQITAEGAKALYDYMQVDPKVEQHGHGTVIQRIKIVGNATCTRSENFENTNYDCEIQVEPTNEIKKL